MQNKTAIFALLLPKGAKNRFEKQSVYIGLFTKEGLAAGHIFSVNCHRLCTAKYPEWLKPAYLLYA